MNDNRRPYGTDRDPAPEREDREDWNRVTDSDVDTDIVNEDVLAHVEEIEEDEAEKDVDNDDNPYQESDAALPDDEEEAAISRYPSREGSRFDEI
ncbi:hypothetical protein SAMN04488498_101502 [Mesorhizobium albiziae]|uniref:Uncharacterized protein n=1 Tax=Neomesorhizobium albiziae TaxID=335020 RepID=A0A1I3VM57_9HYPH|nr:hypothetical protein [Mesorhizobium albiziae]GLS28960.1 hypothetical protein GCM10007937_06670 [Mesorhizobium albiziae]SFJ95231.1 hypothetical protein SAMN04488498_101502 [Mesorhizobium albiziae]